MSKANAKVLQLKNTSKKRKSRGKEVKQSRFERTLTYIMAGFIPALSLTLARVAGLLHVGEFPYLSGFAAFIAITVLSVSLPHLAHAVKLITCSSKRVSWALAVAFDCGIVLSELVHATGPQNLHWVALGMLIALSCMSAVLNAIAFTRH